MTSPDTTLQESRTGGAQSRLVVIVCGGRAYSDRETLDRALNILHERFPAMTVITGGAGGADRMASAWAKINRIPQEIYPAEWRKFGRAAGPKRNDQMLGALLSYRAAGCAVGIVAFPGGAGTGDMKRRAAESGVLIWEPTPSPAPRRAL